MLDTPGGIVCSYDGELFLLFSDFFELLLDAKTETLACLGCFAVYVELFGMIQALCYPQCSYQGRPGNPRAKILGARKIHPVHCHPHSFFFRDIKCRSCAR